MPVSLPFSSGSTCAAVSPSESKTDTSRVGMRNVMPVSLPVSSGSTCAEGIEIRVQY